MAALDRPIDIPLPKGWSKRVRSGALHAISLARFSLTVARGHAAHSWDPTIRLREENDRLRQEVALLREELRIKDPRMERIPPQRRPVMRHRFFMAPPLPTTPLTSTTCPGAGTA